MKKYKDFFNLIKHSKRISLIAHTDPDADALSSMCVLKEFLSKEYDVEYIDLFAECKQIADNCKPYLKYVKINQKPKDYDTAILLDCNDAARTGIYGDVFYDSKVKISIDHHSTNKHEAELNIVEPVSSTCEIVYKILKSKKYRFTRSELGMLYAGIVTDTNNLRVGKMTADSFNIVADIIAGGVEIETINNNFFNNNTLTNLRLFAKAIENIESYENGRIVISSLTKKNFEHANAVIEDTVGISSRLTCVSGAIFTCIIREKQQGFDISMRAAKGYDVSLVAQENGGGGHIGAAGFESNDRLNNIKERLLTAFKKQLNKNKPKQNELLFG